MHLGKFLQSLSSLPSLSLLSGFGDRFVLSPDCLSSRPPQKKENPLKSPKKLRFLLLPPLLLLIVSLPSFGMPSQNQTIPSSTAQSQKLNESPSTSEQVFQLTESQLHTLFDQVAKQASDKAVQLTVAEYKPKLDAALLDLKTADTEKWKMAGEGFLVGAALVAVIVVIRGFVK